MGYVYAMLGTRRILFGLAPLENEQKQKELVRDARGMGYTSCYYSSIPVNCPSRNELR